MRSSFPRALNFRAREISLPMLPIWRGNESSDHLPEASSGWEKVRSGRLIIALFLSCRGFSYRLIIAYGLVYEGFNFGGSPGFRICYDYVKLKIKCIDKFIPVTYN